MAGNTNTTRQTIVFRGLPFFAMSGLFLIATGLIFFARECAAMFGDVHMRFQAAFSGR